MNKAAWTLAIAMIGVALYLAIQATLGLVWPCEVDFYRDMGGAQAVLDGFPGYDPAYLGEINWYNPFQPTLLAALSWVSGLPLHMVFTRFGPYVNLLGPIGFVLMARKLMPAWAAVAALGAYLFLGNPLVPSWFQATYSPWAWPMDFAQGFFYLTMAAYVRALETRRVFWEIATGMLLGLTFLAHTAPTLIVVALLTSMTLFAGRGERLVAIRRYAIIGFVSLFVASPYLLPLVINYKLNVLNRAPSEHENIGVKFIFVNLLRTRAAVAVLGFVATLFLLFRSRAERTEANASEGIASRVLLAFLVSAVALLGYGMLAQGLHHREIAYLPRVLPTYHFHLYAKSAESLFFGVGLFATVGWLLRQWRSHRGDELPSLSDKTAGKLDADSGEKAGKPGSSSPHEGWAVGLALVAIVALHFPQHLNGVELSQFREDSEKFAKEGGRIGLYHWLLDNTKPTDVFLADMHVALWAVSAADRKVVCLGDQYSNLYVDYVARFADLAKLYGHLRKGESTEFDALAAKYKLTHVVVTRKPQTEWYGVPTERMTTDRFTLLYENEDYRVFRRLTAEERAP